MVLYRNIVEAQTVYGALYLVLDGGAPYLSAIQLCVDPSASASIKRCESLWVTCNRIRMHLFLCDLVIPIGASPFFLKVVVIYCYFRQPCIPRLQYLIWILLPCVTEATNS